MACGCTTARKEVHRKETNEGNGVALSAPRTVSADTRSEEDRIIPTTQCIACCQKHMDEAWCLFNEYGYSDDNRRFIRGNLRAIVLHSFKEWKDIAAQARKCALLVQEAKDDEAFDEMRKLCEMIDEEFYKVNPEVRERLDKLAKSHSQETID